MVNLIPSVKKLAYSGGFLHCKEIFLYNENLDNRVLAAVNKFPCSPNGIPLKISVTSETGEGYRLDVRTDAIVISADSSAGAFYAIQTLRQLFTHEKVPCLHIEDQPDFPYRGFYQDVSRGKIPTLETLKELIDRMAYYKLNSLQLYVEHTFEFEECKDINPICGYLTKDELQELDAYCKDHFIEFIPSISTFGHMYELLQQPKYQHLRAVADDEHTQAVWYSRMVHHTIDPRHPESLSLVQSLIDQYAPCFESDWFNICCDETFDLHNCATTPEETAQLYVDFVKKIIAHTQRKGKKVMMWADILLEHPEVIHQLPENVCFLNWWYWLLPDDEKFARLAATGRPQIVCPGTSTWNRLCEDVDNEEANICQLADFARKYGAHGILNTNWGDEGNLCSLELAMYGMVLGAEKAWSASTPVDEAFYGRVNTLLFENESGMEILKSLSAAQGMTRWINLVRLYSQQRYGIDPGNLQEIPDELSKIQEIYQEITEKLSAQTWEQDEFREEMLLAAEGICVMAELLDKLQGQKSQRMTDTYRWLEKYKAKWLQKNKPNELWRIEEVLRYCETI